MSLINLKSSQFLILFTTAPTGLGHLRVTDALQEGLPAGVHNFVLGTTDPALTYLHRLASVNPLLRTIQYFVQYHPLLEQVFTNRYRAYLRHHTRETFNQLLTLLKTHRPVPKKVIIIATHFGLAHEIAAIKTKLEKETQLKLDLYVVVTDDTFQKIWAVDGADFLIVPSQKTKNNYQAFLEQKKVFLPKVIVNPYPISPKLCPAQEENKIQRRGQLQADNPTPTHLLVPVSGAAVQLDILKKIILLLYRESKPFKITVVSKIAPFTSSFLNQLKRYPSLDILAEASDTDTVNLYQNIFFKKPLPVLEITKPSEQAFKALLEPGQLGGVILLFTKPVGKQEEHNLNFLCRHKLIPAPEENQQLYQLLLAPGRTSFPREILKKAAGWRGLILPRSPQKASLFVKNARTAGLFTRMLDFKRPADPELSCRGVEKFWRSVTSNLFYSKT